MATTSTSTSTSTSISTAGILDEVPIDKLSISSPSPSSPISSPLSSPLSSVRCLVPSLVSSPSSPNDHDHVNHHDNHHDNETHDENNNNDENNENEHSQITGFTKNLLHTINKSRTLLNTYIHEQRTYTNSIIRQQTNVQESEKEAIRCHLQELTDIQYKRGVSSSHSHSHSHSHTDDSGEGLLQQQSSLKEKIMEMERELAGVNLEHRRIDKNVKVVKEIEEREFVKAEEIRKLRERRELSNKITVDDLTLGVLKYQMLGINFVKGDGLRLRCDFTQIDPHDPDRVFAFVLNVNEEEEYEVEDCHPFLNANVVLGLVSDLNDTGLWSSFIAQMRDTFKKSLE